MAEDRLDRLERRVRELEALVREMQPPVAAARPLDAAITAPPALDAPAVRSDHAPSSSRPPLRAPRDAEQWVGQRGLLAVGVVLLILAAAYLLKLAIDRGWISPMLRCSVAAVTGIAVAAVGARLRRRGMATYGAALIGTGAALIYLSLWAATRLFALVPQPIGTAGLVVVSLLLAATAYVIDVEALASAAALGALFAPAVIGMQRPTSDLLLLYVGVIGVTLGGATVARRWRITANLIALTYFGFGVAGADAAVPTSALLFCVIGGLAGMTAGLRLGWTELRLVAFAGSWGVLGLVASTSTPWMPVVAGVALAVPVWLHASRVNAMTTERSPTDRRRNWTLLDLLCFYATPPLVAATVPLLLPAWCALHPGGANGLVAAPYIVAGYSRRRVRFAAAAAFGLTLGILLEWHGITAVWALLVLAVVAAGADHLARRTDGRWYALLAIGTALVHLVLDFQQRGTGPAFRDEWALALWTMVVLLAALALGLWRLPSDATERAMRPGRKTSVWSTAVQQVWFDLGATLPPSVPMALWTLAGAALLLGVTNELNRVLQQAALPPETTRLAIGLSISAWWTLFAGGLVALGFRRDMRRIRVAGLFVAALAVFKVIVFDLAELNALYRVASVLILGVVSLLVAYLYNRRAGSAASVTPAD